MQLAQTPDSRSSRVCKLPPHRTHSDHPPGPERSGTGAGSSPFFALRLRWAILLKTPARTNPMGPMESPPMNIIVPRNLAPPPGEKERGHG